MSDSVVLSTSHNERFAYYHRRSTSFFRDLAAIASLKVLTAMVHTAEKNARHGDQDAAQCLAKLRDEEVFCIGK
jgi:hypothetical protein